MACSENARLWLEYRRSAEAWSRAVELLDSLTATEVVQLATDLRIQALQAKQRYEQHVTEHACEKERPRSTAATP